MFREVPVLPVVVPLAAVVLALLLTHLHRRRRLTLPRAAVALGLCVYAAGIVANTVFPIFLDMPRSSTAWDQYLNLVPIVGYEAADAATNIVVFAPIGVLVPLLAPGASWLRALAVGAATSLAIELAQLVTAHLLGGGHIADVNDLLFNVVGALVGFGVFTALVRVHGAARLVEPFRWS